LVAGGPAIAAEATAEETMPGEGPQTQRQRQNPEHRRLVEGLRMGVVPDCGLKEWTVGRPQVLRDVEGWLASKDRGTLLVEGAYGSGKTHLIRHTAAVALEQGFAVSQVRVDPTEENSSFPLRFYGSVMRELLVPGRGDARLSFRDVLVEAVRTRRETCLDRHPFLGPMVEKVWRNQDTETDWAGLLGERVPNASVPTWMDFTTVANVACNLMSAVSCFLADALEVQGLVLLVDEVETAEVRRYSYHWERTLNFLRGLSMTANDAEELEEAVGRDRDGGVRRGERTGLVYSGHYPGVKYYFRRPSRLKVLLALTECRVSGKLKEWKAEQSQVKLEEIDRQALADLFWRVATAYGDLYKVDLPERVREWAMQCLLLRAYSVSSVRGFVKACVELLDFVRHNPNEPPEVLDAYRKF